MIHTAKRIYESWKLVLTLLVEPNWFEHIDLMNYEYMEYMYNVYKNISSTIYYK